MDAESRDCTWPSDGACPATLGEGDGTAARPSQTNGRDPMSNRSFEGLDATLGGMHLRPPTIVSASDTVAIVAAALVRDGVSCAILEESPLRVVTEFDLVRGLARGSRPEDEIATVASEHPNWAPPSASVAEAAALMVSLGIRHLVVLDTTESQWPSTRNSPTSCSTEWERRVAATAFGLSRRRVTVRAGP